MSVLIMGYGPFQSSRTPNLARSCRPDRDLRPHRRQEHVGTAASEKSDGCNSRKVYLLRINSGGGQIEMAIPSEAEARRLQGMIERLISNQ